MPPNQIAVLGLLCLLGAAPFKVPAMGAERGLTAQDVVERHLRSLGSPPAIARIGTRHAGGKAKLTLILGGESSFGSGQFEGRATLISEGHRLGLRMLFPSSIYPGEQCVYDGKKISVKYLVPRSRYSLADFLDHQAQILKEGLLGGVLVTAWPLLDLKERQARLHYDGLKKIDKVKLHRLTYTPKDSPSDLEIRLYFEPETFHHVKTVYTLLLKPGAATSPDASAKQVETRYTLQEDFGGFQAVDGLTLPTQWKIHFSAESADSHIASWEIAFETIVHNRAVAPQNFQIQ